MKMKIYVVWKVVITPKQSIVFEIVGAYSSKGAAESRLVDNNRRISEHWLDDNVSLSSSSSSSSTSSYSSKSSLLSMESLGSLDEDPFSNALFFSTGVEVYFGDEFYNK